MIRLLIVDDHQFVRQGLERLAALWDGVEVVGMAGDGEEGVSLYGQLEPDVVLMDLGMQGAIDGVEATRRITGADAEAKVVVLTSLPDREHIERALDARAVGYVLKHASAGDIESAVRAAARGESPLDPKVARVLMDRRRAHDPIEELSQREREVLTLVGRGLPNKQIAWKLGITERTVKGHLTSIYRQIGVDDRVQAALWARGNGLTEPARVA